jgi:multiple sugar transport system substrate-binding protein
VGAATQIGKGGHIMTRVYRTWFVLIALVTTVVLFSSVGHTKTTISVTICCGQLDRHEWLTSTAEAFMQQNPSVEVQPLLNMGLGKITTMVAGGVAPDLIWVGTAWGSQLGYLAPLTEFFAKNAAYVRDLVPGMVRGFSFANVNRAIPFSASSRVTAFNPELLQRAGLSVPTRDWTWSDALALAKKVTEDKNGDGIPDVWGMAVYWQPWGFFGYGGSIYKDNGRNANIYQEAVVKAASIWMDLHSGKAGIMPTPYAGITDRHSALFADGRLAFWDIGIFDIPALRQTANFDWDVQEHPVLEHGGQLLRGGHWKMWPG